LWCSCLTQERSKMGKGLIGWARDAYSVAKSEKKRIGKIKDKAMHKTKPLTYTPVRSKPKGKKKR
jgi:hypothetical protein